MGMLYIYIHISYIYPMYIYMHKIFFLLDNLESLREVAKFWHYLLKTNTVLNTRTIYFRTVQEFRQSILLVDGHRQLRCSVVCSLSQTREILHFPRWFRQWTFEIPTSESRPSWENHGTVCSKRHRSRDQSAVIVMTYVKTENFLTFSILTLR
jgi:hypothetical protein